jgi:ATP-dependent helicase/nuclease subunit A
MQKLSRKTLLPVYTKGCIPLAADMEKYLNIKKSVIISSPAGSGKTEKLARRYVSLLLSGSRIEDILAITFTEKAAAEMKQRILNILEAEHPGLFVQIREKMPFMRISTIHSFCLKLLKRFSIELGLDPSIEVMDEFNASTLWTESIYECLMEEKENPDLFFSMIVERGIKGWNSLFKIINDLHSRRPHPEVMVREDHPVSGEEQKILALYARCLERYTGKKRERHLIDFNDIEMLAYDALVRNPEWQNILYSFDEHTDHILVDEFQDTSSLQWKIIDKLTEEWRSGIGAKRDRGEIPTIFLVGDDKQSIYLFRGANAGIFQEAKSKLSEWLAEEFYFEAMKENYRSLPDIVDFVNSLFSRLMPPGLIDQWRTTYSPFEAMREGNGQVELILLDGEESIRKNRELEASVLARRISSLNAVHEVWDGGSKRKCRYGDMAVLLRKRTHLTVYEEALRHNGIPFIVVKGIGFYDEPEVALLRELLFFLIDPYDDHSLFCLLRSPLFGIDYGSFTRLAAKNSVPLVLRLGTIRNKRLAEAHRIISTWLDRSKSDPFAGILEDALSETGGWRYFAEPQRHANVRKFIALIEEYEAQSLCSLEIREKLIQSKTREESKAHMNAEGMNAVQVMTIHAAKGLQFPMIFLPGLDEETTAKSTSVVIDEDGNRISLAYEEDSVRRKEHYLFRMRREKELEEEKRLFYVAVTRAQDFLCMLAAPKKGKHHAGRLKYITDNLDCLQSLRILKEPDIDTAVPSFHTTAKTFSHDRIFLGQLHTEALAYKPLGKWRDVTEDLDIRVRHGDDWVLLGRVFHTLFEELSKEITPYEKTLGRALFLLRNQIPLEKHVTRLIAVIDEDFSKLDRSGYLHDIILPQKNAFSEQPFILEKDSTVYKGRIDRIIIRDSQAYLYDYKTFPVTERELPELIDHYRFQMDIYRAAAERLFSMKSKGHLFFTHLPLLVEI